MQFELDPINCTHYDDKTKEQIISEVLPNDMHYKAIVCILCERMSIEYL